MNKMKGIKWGLMNGVAAACGKIRIFGGVRAS
jgi:hypothetical protein